MAESALDVTLCGLLLCLAGGAVFARNLVACASLFIGFGVLLAVTWVRLNAVDLALAEAAIGAGLTGILLLTAIEHGAPETHGSGGTRWRKPLIAVVLISAVGGFFLSALLSNTSLTEPASALPARLAHEALGESGVEHPVTAVLLNFRAWDTALELAVLLLALLGVKQLQPLHRAAELRPWPVLEEWSKVLLPLMIVTGGYLLWRGSSSPGGAFQAGAVLAAGAAILRLNQMLPPLRWSLWPTRGLILLGLTSFLVVAAGTHWWGDGWLSYVEGHRKSTIVALEACATLSIALALTLLVAGDQRELSA